MKKKFQNMLILALEVPNPATTHAHIIYCIIFAFLACCEECNLKRNSAILLDESCCLANVRKDGRKAARQTLLDVFLKYCENKEFLESQPYNKYS